MMTTEYCPATEIQRMEQELWTLTLKGDDTEAYNNRFHELVLMCPELVPAEKKKIEKYIRGFPEGVKRNVTSSKPATLHDAINMARELIEQGVQAKAARIGESNKRKWEDHQGNNKSHNHHTHHQQQNRRQEDVKAYAAAPTERKGYLGTRPLLELPQELSKIHHTFHVSNLKKCHVDEPLVVPLDGLQIDDKLHFIEESIEIRDREVKRLKPSCIPLVKVRWNSRQGAEYTWEREDQFQKKYLHLFSEPVPSSSAAT
ncbi:putative reverse transcriptase domain-containing protein [Tanacetum coccineum]